MTWNEHAIARAISLQVLQRKCVLLVPNCSWTGSECDVLGITTDLRVIDIEVKISRADLKADAAKDKWWHWRSYSAREAGGPPQGKRWPNRVWKHYFAVPAELWSDDLLRFLPSPASGVLLLRQNPGSTIPVLVQCARRSTPNRSAERLTPEQVMDVARLANLRMWDAYAQRDRALARQAPAPTPAEVDAL
ncbi:hypothetical protein ABXN37_19775 [Piscinibacter sakaiensis]|uniref:MmcB family DNA repair protein n=1 Tax=Piscinibacter sakaiensis TaxID=1547922 RepID=A0A0K8P587_PISS1|nr:hypothetical protein [Piscinibacter sakaiensis]GAP37365.1 hypothetical protein ISF6_3220 [Piscinibacter sakaiensis]